MIFGDLESLLPGREILLQDWPCKLKFLARIYGASVNPLLHPHPTPPPSLSLIPLIHGHMTTKPKDATLSLSALCFLVSVPELRWSKVSSTYTRNLRKRDLYHFYQKFWSKKYDFTVSPQAQQSNGPGPISLTKPPPKDAPLKIFLTCRRISAAQQR